MNKLINIKTESTLPVTEIAKPDKILSELTSLTHIISYCVFIIKFHHMDIISVVFFYRKVTTSAGYGIEPVTRTPQCIKST